VSDELRIARAWRAIMLNDDGTLKPDAELIMRDLERVCGWMVSALPTDDSGRVDPLRTAAALEKRGVYAHAKKRLYGPLDRLLAKEQKG
jgi:hypothetical protein